MTDVRRFIANDEITGTMLSELVRAFSEVRPDSVRIATAYFTPDGFREIQPGLQGAGEVRILLGERPFMRRRGPGELLSGMSEDSDHAGPLEAIDWFEFLEGDLPWVLMTHDQRKRLLDEEGEESYEARREFDLSAWQKVQELVRFLSRPDVEVRRYLGPATGTVPDGEVLSADTSERLHAKAYILREESAAYGAVGSSNLTKGGLQNNIEANLITMETGVVDELEAWFDRKWDESQDCKAEFIHLLEECVLFGRRFTPWHVFLKALHAAYGNFLGIGLDEEVAGRLALFQQEGVARAIELLERHWGAMVCDSVGLGKTFIGLGVLREYTLRKSNRVKALVVCPAQLEGNWSAERLHANGVFGETVSMEYLPQLADIDEIEDDLERERRRRKLRRLQDCDIVLVDESHNFRNRGTKRYRALMEIIRAGAKPDKRVLLLTATPINNTLWDLYHQLMLITRGDNSWYAGRGPVGNLEGEFRALEKTGGGPGLLNTMLLTLVRRTRHDIRQRQEAGEPLEVDGRPLEFPEHEIPRAVTYGLEELYGDVYSQVIKAIESLNFAVYNLEAYGIERPGAKSPETKNVLERNNAYIGIVRTIYLKRMESSVAALMATLRNQVDYLDLFLSFLDQGKVLFAKERDRLRVLLGGGLDDEALEAADASENVKSLLDSLQQVDAAKCDVSEVSQAVRADRDALRGLLQALEGLEAADPEKDPKVAALRAVIDGLPALDDNGVPVKVVVFTNYRDTAMHLFKAFGGAAGGLKGEVRAAANLSGERWISLLTGSDDKKRRAQVLAHFAPLAALREDRDIDDPELAAEIAPFRERGIDVLIATDVLSEGQNLQDAQYLINYDLHWNPVRMIQRAGRIDRLFSPHERVYFYNVMPEKGLEDLLKLVKRLSSKVKKIDATLGLDASVLGEVIEAKALDDLMRIQQGGSEADAVYLEGERRAEFDDALDQLRSYIDLVKSLGTQDVRSLPDGIHSIRYGEEPGVFLQLKMPEEYGGEVFWRFYPADASPAISSAIEAASRIACEPGDERAELGLDDNPFQHLIEPLKTAIAELGQEYQRRMSAQDPGELVRLIRLRLSNPEVQERLGDLTDTLFDWCNQPHPSDLLKREDSVAEAYRALKVAGTDAGVTAESLERLWLELEAKGLDRPLPRPTSRAPSERDLQLVCWELVIPQR
ncbi:MAG: phospholipase D-like domain-containing protein [Actinobacteria bacterium]|nr:phospholipase D-like domain-containing protein [Actinomycetota bacterium]MCL5887649.1 phospholipase D-like domain-containing protein [Actinomycetota bacterium]